MKKFFLPFMFCFVFNFAAEAQIENTSYINTSNEKVLQLSMVVPLERNKVWEFFSKDEKLAQWIAPLAHIDLKSGGYILTNYDKTKTLTDSSSIKLDILSFLENELLILKVNLNDNFSKKVQQEDEYLQEIIQFITISPGKTKIISSMIGWGQGKDWEKTYDFFKNGNEWSYNEFLKILK